MYRVVVADDHPAARLGMRLVVEDGGSCEVVGEAANGRELIEAVERQEPDMVITDLSMDVADSTDGLAMIKQIRRKHPLVKVIILTISGGPVMVDALVRLGVCGVVSKRDGIDQLMEALRNYDKAGTYVSKEFHCDELEQQIIYAHGRLTRAEVEVLRQLANNMSVSAIALRSSRSKATISKQKASAMKKLGLDDSTQLYTYLSSLRGGARAN